MRPGGPGRRGPASSAGTRHQPGQDRGRSPAQSTCTSRARACSPVTSWATGPWLPSSSRRPRHSGPGCTSRLGSRASRGDGHDGTLRCGPNPRHAVVAQFGGSGQRISDAMARDDLRCHLAHSPGVIRRCLGDRCGCTVVPGVKETACRPDPRPVARLPAFPTVEHVPCGRSAEREHKLVIYLDTALEQADAPGDHGSLAASLALREDALSRCQVPDSRDEVHSPGAPGSAAAVSLTERPGRHPQAEAMGSAHRAGPAGCPA